MLARWRELGGGDEDDGRLAGAEGAVQAGAVAFGAAGLLLVALESVIENANITIQE